MFSLQRSFSALSGFTPTYFENSVNRSMSTISFSACLLVMYRKAIASSRLSLYTATLLKLLIVSRSFLVEL